MDYQQTLTLGYRLSMMEQKGVVTSVHGWLNHSIIGWVFRGPDEKVYLCDSYEGQLGYWMHEMRDPSNRRNVSYSAIGRTFHESHHGNSQLVTLFHKPDGKLSSQYDLTVGAQYAVRGIMGDNLVVDTNIPGETCSVHHSRFQP